MDSTNINDIFQDLNNIDLTDSSLKEKCTYLAQATTEKIVTIHAIIENLGSLLINTAPDKRELGMLILSQILENLPHDFLTATELNFISSFYSDRLKDHHQVVPVVLQGILVIIQMQNLPEGAPHKILTALFENVPCQQQQLKDRQNIYNIFKELLNRRPTEMKALGIDLVLGVIQAMDGERDPRNLYLLFNWLPEFFQSIPLGHLSEEMFDVMSCYFPVDFRTPTNDSQSVTRDDLANALCPCLCAVPSFAEFCVPLIIDKLNSSLKIAKYDSLNLLAESCKTFNVSIYKQHSHDIWNLLQKETLNCNDPEIENASLNAISAIIHLLSQSETEFVKQVVDNLYETLKGNLRPDTKLFLPSSKILIAVARASEESCSQIVPSTIDLLLSQFNFSNNISHKEILFRTLLEFIIAYIKLFEIADLTEIIFLKNFPNLCLELISLSEIKIKIIALESLTKIAKTLPVTTRNKVYEMLKTEIISEQTYSVRTSILKCFKIFSNIYKSEVLEIIQSYEIDKNNILSLKLYLEALCVIVSEKLFSEIILSQILNLATNSNFEFSKVSVKCLKNILEENDDSKIIQTYLYFDCKIIDRITNWILLKIKENQTDFELLEDVSTIIKIIVGFQTKEEQEMIIKSHVKELINNYRLNNYDQEQIIFLLEGFLIRIRPEVEISEKYQLICEFLQLSPTVQEHIYLYACMLIANIINKCSEDENFLNMLNEIEGFVENSLENPSNDLHIKNIIHLISWITKSLIIRGSNKSNLWTDKLISLLDKYEEVAKSFRLIMDDSHDCLSKKSYCSNRLLYRQKFFAYVCKKFCSNYSENTPNYLIALGYLLQFAPQQVIILYFKETLRLLVFCLELCRDPEVLCAVLNTLKTLILTKEPYLENHIEDLLPRFLNLTKFEPSMKVRIAALNCIKEFPNGYPIYKLLPHKQKIIFGLESSVDDKKRLVRKIAVETRSHWFLLDAPT